MRYKILWVEDEQAVISGYRPFLRRAGFEVIIAHNGEDGLQLAYDEKPDLILLDVMLPGRLQGWDLCKHLRQNGQNMPIIMLSVLDDDLDRLEGLVSGAIIHLTKPINPKILVAQIKTILQSIPPTRTNRLVKHDLVMDVDNRTVYRSNTEIPELSRLEFDLLYFLASNAGMVIGAETLLSNVWGDDMFVETGTVRRHISSLRKKLELDPTNPSYILTIRGVGYKFRK